MPCIIVIYDTHKAFFVKIYFPNVFSVVIGDFYRPPHCSIINFNDYINSTLFTDQRILRSKCILVGDFNIYVQKLTNASLIIISIII